MREYSSFRDPSGFVFQKDGIIYRQINVQYIDTYRMLMDGGLYKLLVKHRLMVPHEEVIDGANDVGNLHIRPKRIPFISYPYEWCFSQYKQAAITTLQIHLYALEHGMVLKDSSAYNIQFLNGYAVLVDTLSFERYREGYPWGAYGQFCRHFLAPLLLMARVDLRLSKLMMSYIDGIPLDLADSMLRGKQGLFELGHIRLHARSITHHGEDGKKKRIADITVNKRKVIAMLQSILSFINKLTPKKVVTEWSDYYKRTNYTEFATNIKKNIVSAYLNSLEKCSSVWDFGANDGQYSRLALARGSHVVAFDIDHNAVERNFMEIFKTHEALLPLVLDLTNPSPSIGFANRERVIIGARQKPDVILMLAVIHHLAISNNLPFEIIAQWVSSLCNYLIIEFVPKEDSQVQILLCTREDIFTDYTEKTFENVFTKYFTLVNKQAIEGSSRILYLFHVLKTREFFNHDL